MREFEQDGEHIWLRQSVTFTVGGQTRTLEIAIPVRPGASADDVERLLTEADAGMERLSRHLDARVAVQTGAAPPVAPSAEPAPEPTAPVPSSRPAAPEPAPTASAASSQPVVPQPAPAAARPQPSPTRRSVPTPDTERPAPPTTAPSTPQPEMARPEFIAEIGRLGLDVKQAMARLGVRSLQGLNLREALEALRRQMLQEGGAAEPEPEPAPPPASAASSAHFFEEEDDEPEFTFTVNGEEGLPEEQESTSSHDAVEAVEELDLDDVPDFGPAPAAPRRTHTVRESPARARAERQGPAPAEPAPETAPVSRAQQLITEMRAARGGGTPTSYQRASYKNIVVNELGDDATALVHGLWRVPPERLGPEQIDALISWGKRDTFADEAAEVLAALRAEHATQSNQTKNAPARGRGTTRS